MLAFPEGRTGASGSPRTPPGSGTPATMASFKNAKTWLVVVLLVAATGGALSWLLYLRNAVRAEARGKFFEQYNRQQLLLAEQASRTVEQLFDTFRRDLSLVASLFETGAVTRERVLQVEASLARIYDSLADAPVVDLAVFDRQGTVIWSYPPSPGTVGVDLSWRDYFAWARDKGQPGQVYLTAFRKQAAGMVKGVKALNVVEGIYGKGRTFKGLALFTVNFDELAQKHVASVKVGQNGYAWLADAHNRTVLVDPRGRVTGQGFEEAFLPRWPGLYSLLLSTRDGRPGTGSYDYEDPVDPSKTVRKLVGYAPVRIGDRLWVLGVATPEREVEALLTSFLRRQEVFSNTLGAVLLAGASIVCALLLLWNRMLFRQVAVRTRDLADARAELGATFEELLAARKLAAVGNLALGLAHEIRNPLSAIRMNVQMIREESPADGHLSENFAIVEEEIQRLNRLLNDVMGFARPRPLRLVQADLGEELQRVVRLMRRPLAEEQIEVDVRADGDLRIACDPEQLQQVLLNLVLNAVDAMREAPTPKRLSISVARSGKTVFLRVSDTGVGVRPEDRDRIFDPFFTTKAQGGGLGLPTLQSIVLRHGGGVDVESDGASWTTFIVRLPVDGPPSSEGQGKTGPDAAPGAKPHREDRREPPAAPPTGERPGAAEGVAL